MDILITGSTGFVGKNLSNYLIKHNIKALTRQQCNNFNGELIGDSEVIIHLAGKAHDLQNVSDESSYYEINYKLTKKIYNAFLASNAKKFIFMSSVKASADIVIGELSESDVPNPLTHYGKSKLMAENYILNQKIPDGKVFYILRPCMIHGPGNKGNLNLLFNMIKKGFPYPLASFQNQRSFLSVENLCFVINELIYRDDIPSGLYNLSDDKPLSTNDVIKLMAGSLQKKHTLWYISPMTIRFIARIGDYLNLPITSEKLKKLTESYVVSNNKITSLIKKPLPLTSLEGLMITIDSLNTQLTKK